MPRTVLFFSLLYDAELNCPRGWDLPARSVGLAPYVAGGTADIPGLVFIPTGMNWVPSKTCRAPFEDNSHTAASSMCCWPGLGPCVISLSSFCHWGMLAALPWDHLLEARVFFIKLPVGLERASGELGYGSATVSECADSPPSLGKCQAKGTGSESVLPPAQRTGHREGGLSPPHHP